MPKDAGSIPATSTDMRAALFHSEEFFVPLSGTFWFIG